MLKDICQNKIKGLLYYEQRQLFDEGKDVAAYLDACKKADANPDFSEKEAEELAAKMAEAPMRADYAFVEPSDYSEIEKQCAPESGKIYPALADEKNISGAWSGRLAGCALGKPVECWHKERIGKLLNSTGNAPMSRYINLEELLDFCGENCDIARVSMSCLKKDVTAPAFADDDTNYTAFAAWLIENYGFDFQPEAVLAGWLQYFPFSSVCTAERVAYRNAYLGLTPPETALHKNPYREWIGAQIRADFYGYICPGNPKKAAWLAYKDATVSHIKNGIYGSMFIAALLALAPTGMPLVDMIKMALYEIPQKSRLKTAIDKIIDMYEQHLPAAKVLDYIHQNYDEKVEYDWCHTIPNASIVVYALLYGENDFSKSICMTVESAFDTDCNGATVGSVLGYKNGINSIDKKWLRPFDNKFYTNFSLMLLCDINELTKKTLSLIK